MPTGRRRHSTGIRIVGGRWGGRRLAIPADTEVRPTPDRVRETLFNWLVPALEGASCLDLFAGSGVLGLEALSRGAAQAWFVEHDAVLAAALRKRMGELGAQGRVIRRDAHRFLASRPRRRFDVVFVDPPYATGLSDVLDGLAAWLAAEHLVFVERPASRGAGGLAESVATVPGAELVKQGRAASVAFGLLRLPAAE